MKLKRLLESKDSFLKSHDDIKMWLDERYIGNYTINDDLSVDVDGDVELQHLNLFLLPFQFNHVTGNFNCARNHLISLEGAPRIVDGSFYCDHNKLTSLEHSPREVGGNFDCFNNRLTTLEGSPKEVGGSFDCMYNYLETLEGAPKEVIGNFHCRFEKEPDHSFITIHGEFHCSLKTVKD